MTTFCNYYNSNTCVSCNQISVNYSDQLKSKEKKLLELLSFFKEVNLKKTIPSQEQHFRHKAKMIVSGSLENPIISIPVQSTSLIPKEILNCPIHHPEINRVISFLPAFIKQAKIAPYDILKKSGEIKGLILFYSEETNETYLRFVLRSKESVDRIKNKLSLITDKFLSLKCVTVNIQPKHAALLEGDEEIFLTESHFILHQLGDIQFSLHPKAFVQTNPQVAKALYQTASEWIKELKINTFIELFSGQGAFSFFCSPYTKKSIGFEINPEAVQQANLTAKMYQKSNLEFRVSDAKDVSGEVKKIAPDLILVNPPRKGLGESLQVLIENKPKYLLYSSCSAETLANDLKKLSSFYQLERCQIFDMFPHSEHFETLVFLKLLSES